MICPNFLHRNWPAWTIHGSLLRKIIALPYSCTHLFHRVGLQGTALTWESSLSRMIPRSPLGLLNVHMKEKSKPPFSLLTPCPFSSLIHWSLIGPLNALLKKRNKQQILILSFLTQYLNTVAYDTKITDLACKCPMMEISTGKQNFDLHFHTCCL